MEVYDESRLMDKYACEQRYYLHERPCIWDMSENWKIR